MLQCRYTILTSTFLGELYFSSADDISLSNQGIEKYLSLKHAWHKNEGDHSLCTRSPVTESAVSYYEPDRLRNLGHLAR